MAVRESAVALSAFRESPDNPNQFAAHATITIPSDRRNAIQVARAFHRRHTASRIRNHAIVDDLPATTRRQDDASDRSQHRGSRRWCSQLRTDNEPSRKPVVRGYATQQEVVQRPPPLRRAEIRREEAQQGRLPAPKARERPRSYPWFGLPSDLLKLFRRTASCRHEFCVLAARTRRMRSARTSASRPRPSSSAVAGRSW